jgi:hypothetical protein
LLEEARNTTDYIEQRSIYDQVQSILAIDLPNVFLLHQLRIDAFNNDFHGLISSPSTEANTPYILEKTYYEPTLSAQGKCPMKICLKDSQGRRTGYFNGTGVNEIPDSEYVADQELTKLRSPLGNYSVEVYGTGNGTYSLELVNIASDYKNIVKINKGIRLSMNHTYAVFTNPDGSFRYVDEGADLAAPWHQISLTDLVKLANAYGSKPGDPNWNPMADINVNDKVDLADLVMLANNYGKTY